MLDRIVMDVIHMGFEVPFIPNRVFPKPPLPYIIFAFCILVHRDTRLTRKSAWRSRSVTVKKYVPAGNKLRR